MHPTARHQRRVIVTFLADGAAAAVSAIITNVFELLSQRGDEERRARAKHAQTLAAALEGIVTDLRMLEQRRSAKRWKKRVRALYLILDELQPILPFQWRHLKGSVRDSVGNAIGGGIVFVDLLHIPNDAALEPPSRWTMHAADYLEETARAVRFWGATRSTHRARRQRWPSYNSWVNHHNLQH